MKLILNNPYRIAGILSNASTREVLARKNRISAYAKVGKEINSEYDFPFFDSLHRSNVSIDKAFSDIEQNQNKVFHSLFWFINLSTVDNVAIQHLTAGNKEKATEIWDKLTEVKEVTPKNFSAFNNIGTLYLLGVSNVEIKKGITAKFKLIESESFQDFVHSVADENFAIDKNKQIEILINELLLQFKNSYSTAETIELFSNCNGTTQKHLSKKFTQEPIHKIETQIEHCTKKRSDDKSNAYRFGTDLYSNTNNELTLLKSIAGSNDLQYKLLADNVAKEMLQCSVDYFNELQEIEDPSTKSIFLLQTALSIDISQQTANRINENLIEVHEYAKTAIIKKDLASVVKMLEEKDDEKPSRVWFEKEPNGEYKLKTGFKPWLSDAEKIIVKSIPFLINIKAVLKEDNDFYLQLSAGICAKAQNYIIEVINDAQQTSITGTIHYQELKSKLKEAWKITQLLGCLDMNFQFKNNYEENKQALKNLCSTVDVETPSYNYGKIPQLNFIVTNFEIINFDKNNNPLDSTKPIYDKFTRYVGLSFEINSFENQTIEFFLKYINPNGSVKSNPNFSSDEYTQSQTEKLNLNTNSICISSLGNANYCIYSIGSNRIELYVNGFMINSKEFVVDITPSEKIEKRLSEAEAKLKEFKQKVYLQSEINSAKNELIEINKFQLFRGSSDKQRQIINQQNRINELLNQSEKEKLNNIKNQESEIEKLKSELLEVKY